MPSPYPTAYRIIDYGGEVGTTTKGGYCVEYWAVVGLARNEWEAARSLGLPKVGDDHYNPELAAFVGTVQSVTCVQEMAPTSWIAKVIYTQGGTFNFTSRIGSEGRNSTEDYVIPIIRSAVTPQGDPFYFVPKPDKTIKRATSYAVYTHRTGESPTYINRVTAKELFKVFNIDDLFWQLLGVKHYTNANGETRVETTFSYRAPIQPDNELYQSAVPIPALPANADYIVDINAPLPSKIRVDDPAVLYGVGNWGLLRWFQ